jgi:hypothetical protein
VYEKRNGVRRKREDEITRVIARKTKINEIKKYS